MRRNVMLGIVLVMMCVGWGWLLYQTFWRPAAAPTGGEGLLRFHVIASGDSVREQAVKLMVRDAVIRTLSDDLAETDDAEEAKHVVLAKQDEIIEAAKDALRKAGEDDKVRMEVGRFSFPMRQYGDLVLPAGDYEAVRIVIGEGKGRNWWCVLFPPLCMVDAAVAVSAQETEQRNEERRIIYRSKAAELLGQ